MSTEKTLEKFQQSVGIALDRFIKERQNEFTYATGELSQLLRDIALAGKIINREINKAGLGGIEGSYGETNIQGEEQQKLDVVANFRFIKALKKGGETCAIISEEDDGIIETGNRNGKYIIAMDPLDGSSNIDVGIPVGTIFSIYRRKSPIGSAPTLEDVLQRGNEQVAAGYIMYGSSTILVYTTGYGVNGFTYEQSLGEYFLSHPDMKAKPESKIYSVNESNYKSFPEGVQKYIESCREKHTAARYIGSLVADFHRNLIKSGIYMYPPTKSAPKGKLRLMFEANPLAFIAEQAGGLATDGTQNIMNIQPSEIHQRCPLFIGSANAVKEVTALMANPAK